MLLRKSVSIIRTEMHLWDEAGNYVHGYDRTLDAEMCEFLDRMIDMGIYALRDARDVLRRKAT